MSKFKVGDIVIGNKKSNRYGISREGCVMKVINPASSAKDCFFGEIIAPPKETDYMDDPVGLCFLVYEDCFDLRREPRPTIVITCDGKTTTATLRCGKTKLRSASVTLYHKDRFDHFTGAEYALRKLFDKPLTDEEKSEPEKKPEYYTGRVVCVDDCGFHTRWTVGKPYDVVDGCVTDDKGSRAVYGPYTSLEHMNEHNGAKFIELRE